MSSSSVNDINEMFDRRLTRPDKIQTRSVNPSASIAAPTQKTAFLEALLRPKIEEPSKVGNAFRGLLLFLTTGLSKHTLSVGPLNSQRVDSMSYTQEKNK